MPETVAKMQPDRAVHLRGFSPLGSSGALTNATPTGFKVSGHWPTGAGDAFAVCVIHDADDFFGHLRLEYLPDFDFSGLTLTFDVAYDAGLQSLGSLKFPTVDWPFLNCIHEDETTSRIKLFLHATRLSGSYSVAKTSVPFFTTAPLAGDRVTLWRHPNTAFTYTAVGGDSSADVVNSLAASINAFDWPSIQPFLAMRALGRENNLELTAAQWGTVSFSGQTVTSLTGIDFSGLEVGGGITVGGVDTTITAVNSATELTVAAQLGSSPSSTYLADRGGIDGNFVSIYTTNSSARMGTLPPGFGCGLSGGANTAVWRVTLDFDQLVADGELSSTQIRQAFFTYAPPISERSLTRTTWSATYTNWAVTGTNRLLKFADPLESVVVHHDDPLWAAFTGSWSDVAGFYSHGFAKQTTTPGAGVTFTIHALAVSDLYVGTSLFSNRGKLSISVDGGAATNLDLFLGVDTQVNTRRKIRSAIAAGVHTVTLTAVAGSGNTIIIDYLQAVVAADVPTPIPAIRNAVRVDQPTATFEILFPFDVNHDEPVGANTLGGALNFYVNWDAVNWNTPTAALCERLKVEALDFGSGSRDMNLARAAIEFYRSDGRVWPVSQVRYLVAAFNGGCPWERELAIARAEALPRIVLWAFDQFCLFSWRTDPRRGDRSQFV